MTKAAHTVRFTSFGVGGGSVVATFDAASSVGLQPWVCETGLWLDESVDCHRSAMSMPMARMLASISAAVGPIRSPFSKTLSSTSSC